MEVKTVKGLIFKIPGPIYAIIGLCIFFSYLSPNFLSLNNTISLLLQAAALMVLAFGMTMAILTAGIDLSLGAIPGLAGVAFALALQSDIPAPIAIIIGLLTGTICGCLNGILIGYFGMDEFVATLGMMGVSEGFVLALSNGAALPVIHPVVRFIGGWPVLGIPIPVWITLFIFIIIFILVNKTKMGTYIYAIGGNRDAASLSGINVVKIRFLLYTINGVLGAVAGIILTGRMNTAHPSSGIGMEFDAIASVVIGGTALSGGEGGVVGTMMGVAVVCILRSGLNVTGLPASWQMVVLGSLITGTIILDSIRRNNMRRYGHAVSK